MPKTFAPYLPLYLYNTNDTVRFVRSEVSLPRSCGSATTWGARALLISGLRRVAGALFTSTNPIEANQAVHHNVLNEPLRVLEGVVYTTIAQRGGGKCFRLSRREYSRTAPERKQPARGGAKSPKSVNLIRPNCPVSSCTLPHNSSTFRPWVPYVRTLHAVCHTQVTIDQVIGGARGIKSMIWETSNLDADEVWVGCVKFTSYTIIMYSVYKVFKKYFRVVFRCYTSTRSVSVVCRLTRRVGSVVMRSFLISPAVVTLVPAVVARGVTFFG